MTAQIDLERQTLIYELIKALRKKDNWCGETHVQKTAYFFEEITGHRLSYQFILYKHGPYSFELSEDLSIMGAYRFVGDEIAHPAYGPRLKPNIEVEEMLLKDFGKLATEFARPMEFVTEKLSGCGVAVLERLATALYFTKHNPEKGYAERARQINQVKPHISQALALEAVKQVDQILDEWENIKFQNKRAQAH
jgi:hypothetical protein